MVPEKGHPMMALLQKRSITCCPDTSRCTNARWNRCQEDPNCFLFGKLETTRMPS